MLPRQNSVSLVIIFIHYLCLLLHMTRLFTQSLSFLYSHLGYLSFSMLNRKLQKHHERGGGKAHSGHAEKSKKPHLK